MPPREHPAGLGALVAAAASWHVTVTPQGGGAHNMALDHALARRAARTGEAVLRVYDWQSPTLSFGRHETALGRYDRDAIRDAGFHVVRRPTGGRAVLHDHEVTYSVTAPLGAGGGRRARARAMSDAINHLLIAALARLGVPAAAAVGASGAASLPTTATPCFDEAATGEIVVAGRKLVGSAQWREPGAVLQHGSILVGDDQARVPTLMYAAGARAAAVATLNALRGCGTTVDDVASALTCVLDDALREAAMPAADPFVIDASTEADTAELCTHYADEGWTWRR